MRRHKSLPPKDRRKIRTVSFVHDAEYYHRQQRADQQPQNYYYGSSHAGHYQDVSDNEENISTTSVSPPPAPTPSDRKYDKGRSRACSRGSSPRSCAEDAINAEIQEMFNREKEHKLLQKRIKQEMRIS